MQNSPVLYHCPQTRSGTTLWMNEELGSPCEIELVNFRNNDQKSADFLKLNPMGKIPTLTHNGVTTTEAGAICAYLADAFPEADLAPPTSSVLRGTYYRWMFFAPSCIEPAMLDKFSGQTRENLSSAGHGSIEDVISAMDAALENGPFLLGDKFSTADVVFGGTLNFALMFDVFEKKPLYTDYVDRLMSRPAALRCQEKNNQYMKDLGWE